MRKFNVTVNGEAFEVQIEEIGEASTYTPSVPQTPPVKTIEKPQEAPQGEVSKPKASKPVSSGSGKGVESPIPGTILSIKAKEGQTVSSGEVVMIIEAMKMENEIVAPEGGTIVSINVNSGDNVQAGDILFSIG